MSLCFLPNGQLIRARHEDGETNLCLTFEHKEIPYSVSKVEGLSGVRVVREDGQCVRFLLTCGELEDLHAGADVQAGDFTLRVVSWGC